MEISAANLTAMFTGFDTIFQRGFMAAPSDWADLVSVARSASRQNFYPWLGRTTGFREWTGTRVLQTLEAHGYTLVNKKFEDSVAIDRDTVEDDQYGVYEPVIEELGWNTKEFPNQLVFGLLKAAATGVAVTLGKITVPVPIAYDGQQFFSDAHPVGPMNEAGADSTYSNINSGGSGSYWYLMDCGRPLRPLMFQERRPFTVTRMNTLTDERVWDMDEYRYGVDGRCNVGVALPQLAYASNMDLSNPANFAAAITALRQIKNDNGLPFGSWGSPNGKRYLVVATDREQVARQLLEATFGYGAGAAGAASSVPIDNIYKGECKLLVSPYLD